MSFFIREMQIKTVMTYHHTSSRIAEIKGLILSSVGEGMEQLELSYPLMGVHLGSATLENSLAISLKIKYAATIWSSNCTPGHLYQRNKNLCSQTNLS